MKFLEKVLIAFSTVSLILWKALNINFYYTFILQAFSFGIFVLFVSIADALNTKNASQKTIDEFRKKITLYKLKPLNY